MSKTKEEQLIELIEALLSNYSLLNEHREMSKVFIDESLSWCREKLEELRKLDE